MEPSKSTIDEKENKAMGLDKFKEGLESIKPMDALQNFKNLIDQAVGVGLFKKSEQIVILYKSIDVLYGAIKVDETEETTDKNKQT